MSFQTFVLGESRVLRVFSSDDVYFVINYATWCERVKGGAKNVPMFSDQNVPSKRLLVL